MSTARWVGVGFILAFAFSVATVIYTGLKVEGYPSEFDVGFRPVTLGVGETQSIELHFDSPAAFAEASLGLTLPGAVNLGSSSEFNDGRKAVMVMPGDNIFTVTVRGVEAGSGYLVARLEADEPIGLYRVFVTVTDGQ